MKLKKIIVLSALFILPLVFYMFLSKGIYHYSNLPILTEKVQELEGKEKFKDHFSIVCFLGENIEDSKKALFNLNETIYKRYNSSLYFQVLVVIPPGTEKEAELIKERLGTYADATKWKFVIASKLEIAEIFTSFDTPYALNEHFGSPYAFIVDRELRLRGRKDDEDTVDGKLYGYNMNYVSVLKNKMRDDISIIYYQLGQSMKKAERQKRKI